MYYRRRQEKHTGLFGNPSAHFGGVVQQGNSGKESWGVQSCNVEHGESLAKQSHQLQQTSRVLQAEIFTHQRLDHQQKCSQETHRNFEKIQSVSVRRGNVVGGYYQWWRKSQ